MKKQLMCLLALWLLSTTIGYTQCLFEDDSIPSTSNAKLTSEAKNGQFITSAGEIRVLVIYVEIDYDDPNAGHYPSGSSVWSVGQLPTYKDDLFDVNWTGTPQKAMTKYFAECSFNTYKVLGDYIDNVVTVKESDMPSVHPYYIRQEAVAQLNLTGVLNTHSGSTISDLDQWHNKTVQGETNVAGPDSPYSYDHVMFIYRNYHGWNDATGAVTSGSIPLLLGYQSDTYSHFNGGGSLPFNIIRHEYSHLLFGNNYFHTSGSHSVGGTTFIGDQKGWSMMGGSESSFQSCNAWDRDRMDWKGAGKTLNISAVDAGVTELNGDLNATIPTDAGIYYIRDFVTTGDALRIKLPFIPSTEFQEYIWVENHQTGANNGSDFDHYIYEDNPCRPNATPGLFMYLQAGKDTKVGTSVYSDQRGHYLRFLPADGMYDLQYDANQMQNNWCVGNGWSYPFEKLPAYANPLTGVMDLENPGYDNNGDNKIYRAEDRENHIEKIGGVYYNNLPYLGHPRHGFTLSTNFKAGVGTNPSLSSMKTMERIDFGDLVGSGRDNRVVRLNGVSIEILEELANGTIKVEVKFDDTDVANDIRWAGNIELNAIAGANGYSLNLKQDNTINIDQGYSATQINNPLTLNGQNYFVEHTLFTGLANSYFHVEQNATVNVINQSTLHLKAGAKLELEDGAKLYIGPDSKLIIEDGATLNLKPGAILEIDENATVEYFNATPNKGLLVGATSYTGNPAKVLVKGKIHVQGGGVKWEHYRDGYYQFFPNHELIVPFWCDVKFTGKGKTRKMIGLEDNTTLTLVDNDIDWINGLVEYGDNSEIELIGTDFNSIACTYNPDTNPTTGSTGLVFNNPTYLFLNGCDFHQLLEGINVDGVNNVSASLNNCKFINNTTLGLKVLNSTNFTVTGGKVDGGTAGLYAQYVDVFTLNTMEIKNTSNAVQFYSVPGAYVYGANIHDNGTGIKGNVSLIYLRNGAKVHSNSLYGVHLMGAYDNTFGNYNTMLTVGDVGCGSIFDNPNVGVWGQDALLNIDAIQHSIDRGDNIVNPNRFDNNGLLTFQFCYGSSAVAPSQINAKGNFWGVSPPDIQASQYQFVANICFSKGGVAAHIPLIHTSYSTCVPTNSCTECYGNTGGGTSSSSSSSSSMMAVQNSFRAANEQFVVEDNSTTRDEFSSLSAVELIKDEANDTWQGKSINNELFPLDKANVHAIQVSKAIKAIANSNARMSVALNDIFKDVVQEEVGALDSKVKLYPNPANELLMIDFEEIDGSYSFVMYNIAGKAVLEKSFTKKHNTVDVSKLPNGIYHYDVISPKLEKSSGKVSIVK